MFGEKFIKTLVGVIFCDNKNFHHLINLSLSDSGKLSLSDSNNLKLNFILSLRLN